MAEGEICLQNLAEGAPFPAWLSVTGTSGEGK